MRCVKMEQMFGKNIIEVLTTGMYKDDTTIYREYIQNAADSIRKAIEDKLYQDPIHDPSIDIEIIEDERLVRITDNGYGVKKSEIKRRLLRVADSEKDEDEDMGYRGIGRLCGLAYCKTLKFITTYPGEDVESTMEWDAEKLRIIQDDPTQKITPEELLNEVISYSEKVVDRERHYFIVELIGIIEGHEDILNKENIKLYISETAPIDFRGSFTLRNEINNFVKKNNLAMSCYNITIDGETIYKRYSPTLYDKKGSALEEYDKVSGLDFHIFTAESGDVLAWMWYGLSSFEKRIPAANQMRGIRLRRHNIEMGDSSTLTRFFPEERGNYYFIGELHVVHKDLRPNNQRDYFRDLTNANSGRTGTIRGEFEEKVKLFFVEQLHPLYYKASTYKNAVLAMRKLDLANEDYCTKQERGFINKKEETNLLESIKKLEEKVKSSNKDIEKLETEAKTNPVLLKVISNINERHKPISKEKNPKSGVKSKSTPHSNIKPKNRQDTTATQSSSKIDTGCVKDEKRMITDDLKHLNARERELIGKVYYVINNIVPEDKAIILIERIQDELNKA